MKIEEQVTIMRTETTYTCDFCGSVYRSWSVCYGPGKCMAITLEWYLNPNDLIELEVFADPGQYGPIIASWCALHDGQSLGGRVDPAGLPIEFVESVCQLVERGQVKKETEE